MVLPKASFGWSGSYSTVKTGVDGCRKVEVKCLRIEEPVREGRYVRQHSDKMSVGVAGSICKVCCVSERDTGGDDSTSALRSTGWIW